MSANEILSAAVSKTEFAIKNGYELPVNVQALWRPVSIGCAARDWNFDICGVVAWHLRPLRRAGIDTGGLFAVFLAAIGIDSQSEDWAAVMSEFEAAQLRICDGKDEGK